MYYEIENQKFVCFSYSARIVFDQFKYCILDIRPVTGLFAYFLKQIIFEEVSPKNKFNILLHDNRWMTLLTN